MFIWSKGLGNITLTVDLRTSDVKWEEDALAITGWIRVPVVWNYRITFESHDIWGLLKVVANRHFFRFFFRGLFVSVKRLIWKPKAP
jgi:hypothetical protein